MNKPKMIKCTQCGNETDISMFPFIDINSWICDACEPPVLVGYPPKPSKIVIWYRTIIHSLQHLFIWYYITKCELRYFTEEEKQKMGPPPFPSGEIIKTQYLHISKADNTPKWVDYPNHATPVFGFMAIWTCQILRKQNQNQNIQYELSYKSSALTQY